MPQGMSIVDRGAIAFSRDGKKLYVPVGRSGRDALPEGGAPAAPAASASPDHPKVTMDRSVALEGRLCAADATDPGQC
jgi:hypothetical protein